LLDYINVKKLEEVFSNWIDSLFKVGETQFVRVANKYRGPNAKTGLNPACILGKLSSKI